MQQRGAGGTPARMLPACEPSGTLVLGNNTCGRIASGCRSPWKVLGSPRGTHPRVKPTNTHSTGEPLHGWEGNAGRQTWGHPPT